MNKLIPTAAIAAAAALLAGGCGDQGLQTSRPPKKIAPARPVLFDCGGKAQVKPSSLVLFCADAGAELTDLHWQGWGQIGAEATGYEEVMTCVPSCVAGGTKRFTVAVRTLNLTLDGARTAYGQLLVAIESPRIHISGLHTITRYSLTAHGPSLETG